ncbi:methylated-DNA--[protein]-cysteine S-methyltransferase [Sandaracinus amylolyticus]|uniref:Methylated-DNA--protein-cysteine methyltransferase n=1 Tax=Sandaracinus amylolyticus TaxID=927083 RepID=A0A0F6SEV5_9BACT|nr:methylated-DNA--[protein]-cysteine S-methyltransferase [Sandaracinus amylolyticus]AKF05854.1 Methylated-DNA--protein-cysteine methyltransferase [Sandaracinus amylolyticus]
METVTTTFDAPFGALRLYARDGALIGVYFDGHRPAPVLPHDVIARDDERVLRVASEQLAEYFAGARVRFEVPIAPVGTAFSRDVWRALAELPFGARVSYAELARRVGRPRAIRAVGAANARNPLSIVVPCHRVIGADGSLTGYAGGLARKEWLLAHEARRAA